MQRIRDFTGYDGIMAYRFDPNCSGHVLAEARAADLQAFLALHYPGAEPRPAFSSIA